MFDSRLTSCPCQAEDSSRRAEVNCADSSIAPLACHWHLAHSPPTWAVVWMWICVLVCFVLSQANSFGSSRYRCFDSFLMLTKIVIDDVVLVSSCACVCVCYYCTGISRFIKRCCLHCIASRVINYFLSVWSSETVIEYVTLFFFLRVRMLVIIIDDYCIRILRKWRYKQVLKVGSSWEPQG